MKYIVLIIATEALVELWKRAMPIQVVRRKLTEWTPFLEIDGQHLFDCGYCLSVWIGAFVLLIFVVYDNSIYFFGALVIHRVSNYVHIVYSIIRDFQLNLRISRRQKC